MSDFVIMRREREIACLPARWDQGDIERERERECLSACAVRLGIHRERERHGFHGETKETLRARMRWGERDRLQGEILKHVYIYVDKYMCMYAYIYVQRERDCRTVS